MGRLVGKVVALTGATGGLGAATARAMAAEGASLILTDLDAAALSALAQALAETPVATVAGDVADPATHVAMAKAAGQRFGALHGLCNIAGILGPGDLADVTPDSFDRIMHVNCLSQLLAAQQAAPLMRQSGGASIVNIASVGALVALPHMAAYCASKAAVLGLTRALAAELAPDIRVNAICPGGIDSGMSQGLLAGRSPEDREALVAKLTGRQLLKRFARPEEIAPMLIHLISDEASFTTGAIIAADAGHSAW